MENIRFSGRSERDINGQRRVLYRASRRSLPVGLRWLGAMVLINPAHAQIGSARYSSIIVDAASGDVLEEVNADEPRHPASLTKMMTLYLTFEDCAIVGSLWISPFRSPLMPRRWSHPNSACCPARS